jgi:Transcription initiation factor TFIID component TAF4 family
MCRGDDDINDVAAMGGVNLAEESQRILGSTEFVGTQIRSVKDEFFLHAGPLHQKIKQIREFAEVKIWLFSYDRMLVQWPNTGWTSHRPRN